MEKKTYIVGTLDAERWNCVDEFDSIEDAIAALDAGDYDGEEGWDDAEGRELSAAIGVKVPIDPCAAILTYDVLERMQEHAGENAGEAAEDFLTNIPDKVEAELESDLRACVGAWLKKHDLWPTFYGVGEIISYKAAKAKFIKAK